MLWEGVDAPLNCEKALSSGVLDRPSRQGTRSPMRTGDNDSTGKLPAKEMKQDPGSHTINPRCPEHS